MDRLERRGSFQGPYESKLLLFNLKFDDQFNPLLQYLIVHFLRRLIDPLAVDKHPLFSFLKGRDPSFGTTQSVSLFFSPSPLKHVHGVLFPFVELCSVNIACCFVHVKCHEITSVTGTLN